MIDEILEKKGLKYGQLTSDERETLNSWATAIQQNQLTLEKVRASITAMRESVERELTEKKDSPTNFISLLTYLIPIIGLIRKWYQDQREIELKARLRNYLLIEILLMTPERAKAQLETAVAGMASSVG